MERELSRERIDGKTKKRKSERKWQAERKDWREGCLGNVQFLSKLKRLCGRRLEPICSPQKNRHVTSHLQSMGRNCVSQILPVKQLSPRRQTFLSICFIVVDEQKCYESCAVSYLSPVVTPGLGLDCTAFQPSILSEVFSSVETSCCALPLSQNVHSGRGKKKKVLKSEQKEILISWISLPIRSPNEWACESRMVFVDMVSFLFLFLLASGCYSS